MVVRQALPNLQSLRESIQRTNAYPSIRLFSHSTPRSQFIRIASFIPAFKFTRPISTQSYETELSHDSRKVVDDLISNFTKKQFEADNQELRQLGLKLTPQIVEAVLKGIRSWKIAHKFFLWAKTQSGYSHSCYAYNAMASILSGVRQNAQLKALASELVDSRCSMTPGALGFFIRCLGSVGLVEEANVLFDQAREMGLCIPSNYTYNCLLQTISKSGFIRLVEMRLDEMRRFGWLLDRYTLTPLLQVYCNAGEVEKALNVFNQMFEMGWVDAHVLSILALSFSRWGEVDKAFELIEGMEGRNLRLSEKTFYVLIHGFVSSHRVDKALQVLDKMHSAGFSPDIAVYDVLIGELCKSKEHEKALCLYSEMKNSGISADAGILTKLISSACEEELMAQLLEEAGDDHDIEIQKLLYNSVLNGLVGHGLVDRAYHLVKMMMEGQTLCDDGVEKFFKLKGIMYLNSTSFTIIINALCEVGRLDEALQLFRGMDKIGCEKDVLLHNNLINALSNADRVADGLDLLREMKHSGFKPTQFTYNSVYGYFCRKGDVVGAKSIMREMWYCQHEPWIKHSTTLVKQLCKHRRVAEACNFLFEMVEEGIVPHLIPYTAVVDGFFKLQEVDQALELYHDILSRGYKPDVVAYNILINGLCKAKRTSEAQDVLNKMLAGGLVPSTVTYNSLIDGWCKSGNIDQAVKCFSKMIGDNVEPNVITYTTLMDGLCNARQPDGAIVLWNEMEVKGCSPNRITFMALISGLCKNGRPDTALFYLREMEKKELTVDRFVYVALMDSFLLNNNPQSAFNILKEIVGKELLPDPIDKNHALVKEAIAKLSYHPQTSSHVSALVAEGSIPITFCLGVKTEE